MLKYGNTKLDTLARAYDTDAGELQTLFKTAGMMCGIVSRYVCEVMLPS
jgi:hypothetical protein